jgi:hypothetical protein
MDMGPTIAELNALPDEDLLVRMLYQVDCWGIAWRITKALTEGDNGLYEVQVFLERFHSELPMNSLPAAVEEYMRIFGVKEPDVTVVKELFAVYANTGL